MSTENADEERSIDTEPQRLEYGSVEFEEIGATGRTEHAALQLPELLDSEAEVALSPDGQIRVFVDARAEVDGAGYLGATLLCDAETATELGYALIQAGRDADERDE